MKTYNVPPKLEKHVAFGEGCLMKKPLNFIVCFGIIVGIGLIFRGMSLQEQFSNVLGSFLFYPSIGYFIYHEFNCSVSHYSGGL